MQNITKLILTIISVSFLISCNAVKSDNKVANTAEPNLCDQVKELIKQHKDGFSRVKGKMVVTRFMDIWNAKYHLVGNNCQIWRWSDGKQAYMCSLTVPNEEVAIEKHEKAVKFSQQCLGNEWTVENMERNQGRAIRSIFSTPTQHTVASVHRVKTDGLFSSEWTVYYFIGDRDRSL